MEAEPEKEAKGLLPTEETKTKSCNLIPIKEGTGDLGERAGFFPPTFILCTQLGSSSLARELPPP